MRMLAVCVLASLLCSCGWAMSTPFEGESVFPENGVWYCQELEVHLSFAPWGKFSETSTILVEGEELVCICRYDLGSSDLYLVCRDRRNSKLEYGDIIYWWTYVELNDNELVLKDHYTKAQYTFIRTE